MSYVSALHDRSVLTEYFSPSSIYHIIYIKLFFCVLCGGDGVGCGFIMPAGLFVNSELVTGTVSVSTVWDSLVLVGTYLFSSFSGEVDKDDGGEVDKRDGGGSF